MAVTPTAGFNTTLEVTGATTSMSSESMNDTGDGVTFRIDDSAKNVWDWTKSFSFSDGNNNTLSASNYTIDYLVGVVVFDSAPTTPVTLDSGNYLPKYTLGRAYTTSLELSNEELDETTFGDAAMRRKAGLDDVSWDFSTYEVEELPIDGSGGSEATLEEILTGSSSTDRTVVLSVDINSNTQIRSAIQFESESVDTPVDGLAEVSMTAVGAQESASMSSQTFEVFNHF